MSAGLEEVVVWTEVLRSEDLAPEREQNLLRRPSAGLRGRLGHGQRDSLESATVELAAR